MRNKLAAALKQRKLALASRRCVSCRGTFPTEQMEGDRDWCRACIAKKRSIANSVEAADIKRARAIPPEKCCSPLCEVEGGRPFNENEWDFRTDSVAGAWRPECRQCGQLYRRTHVASSVIASIRAHATARGIGFVESDVQGMQLKLSEACFYCGLLPGATDPLNRLDRVISGVKLYCVPNVVACCPACNKLKRSLLLGDFILETREFCERTSAPSPLVDGREVDRLERQSHLGHEMPWDAQCSQRFHIREHTKAWIL